MNWDTLAADVNMILSTHFTKGRGGHKIDKIVVHYNAGNLSIAGCYSVWQTRPASAHYQVEESGRIGQLVYDANTAWHCGVFSQNQRSIGIEHANYQNGTISEKCLDSGAHLVAALCKHYGLGRPQWLVNVFPHKYFSSTSCPGQIYGSQKNAYIQRAQQWYDAMNGGSAPAVNPTPSAPAQSNSGNEHTGTGFGGTYRCNTDSLNVRTAPSISASIVAQYVNGQTVTLDDWYKIADGYVWGRYTGASSGKKRYVAVGKPTGKAEAGDFLVKSGSSAPAKKSVDEIAREVIAGKWGNNPQRAQKLSAAGYDADAVQKRVNQLL